MQYILSQAEKNKALLVKGKTGLRDLEDFFVYHLPRYAATGLDPVLQENAILEITNALKTKPVFIHLVALSKYTYFANGREWSGSRVDLQELFDAREWLSKKPKVGRLIKRPNENYSSSRGQVLFIVPRRNLTNLF